MRNRSVSPACRRLIPLSALASLVAAGAAHADPSDIQIDAVSNSGTQTSVSSFNWNHTVGSGATELVVGFGSSDTTCNENTSLTVAVTDNDNGGAAVGMNIGPRPHDLESSHHWNAPIYYSSSAPPAHSLNIAISFGACTAATAGGGAISITNSANSITSATATSSGGNVPIVSLVTSARDFVFADLSIGGPDGSVSGTCSSSSIETLRWSLGGCQASPNGVAGITAPGGVDTTGSSSATTTFTAGYGSSTGWAFAAVKISPASTPTSIRLSEARATARGGGVDVRWRAADRGWNLGYRVHREIGGRRTAASGLLAGNAIQARGDAQATGHGAYTWTDGGAPAGARYWIEEVDLDTRSVFYGPYDVAAAPAVAPMANAFAAAPLVDVGRHVPPTGERFVFPVSPARSGARAVHADGDPPDLSAVCAPLAARAGVALRVRDDRWVRVSGKALHDAGLAADVDPRRLQLYVAGVAVPLRLIGGAAGRLDDADAIEFYGTGGDTPWSATRTHWLAVADDGEAALRVANGWGAPAVAARDVASAWTVLERADRAIYVAAVHDGDAPNFFDGVVTSKPTDRAFTVTAIDPDATAAPKIDVALRGATAAAHRVRVDFDGQHLGDVVFDQQAEGTASFPVPPGVFTEGTGTVTLTSELGDGDVSLIESIHVGYTRKLVAVADALAFAAQAGDAAHLASFGGADVRVVDVTDPAAVVELPVDVTPDGSTFAARVVVGGAGARRLIAFRDANASPPAAIAAHAPTDLLASTGDAELLLLAPRALLGAVAPLRARRAADGWAVAAVDVGDVFDAFGCGDKSPYALRSYLRTVHARGGASGRYALFVGGASFDPRDDLGLGDHDLVPTKLVETTTIETASDDWFGDLDGDGVPEIAIGRLPAADAAEAAVEIAKVAGYHGAFGGDGWQDSAVLVSDVDDGWDFAATSAAVAAELPPAMAAATTTYAPSRAATFAGTLATRLDAGAALVNYAGHGSVAEWAGTFTAAEARALTNGADLPVFVDMTCLNGLFQDPRIESMGQALLAAPAGGAVAVWASSSSPGAAEQGRANVAFVRSLAAATSLGAAARAAKAAVDDPDLRTSFVLLGDPTLFGAPTPPPPAPASSPGSVDVTPPPRGAQAADGTTAPAVAGGCSVDGTGSAGRGARSMGLWALGAAVVTGLGRRARRKRIEERNA